MLRPAPRTMLRSVWRLMAGGLFSLLKRTTALTGWKRSVRSPSRRSSGGLKSQLQMEDNQIYVSREEVSDFRVAVQLTDAAVHCGLQGEYYWLHVGQEELALKEGETRKYLLGWPYRLLRRYGRDKLSFSIEAGRRCTSGPGAFLFETIQAEDIFSRVETAIREQKSVAGDEPESRDAVSKPSPVLPRSKAPLPKLPESANIMDGGYSPRPVSFNAIGTADSVYTRCTDLIGPEECPYSKPADNVMAKALASNSYLPLQPVPTLTPGSNNHGNRLEALYVDPAGVLSLTPPRCTPPPPPTLSFSSGHHGIDPEPVYSEVYIHASHSPGPTKSPLQKKEEPIYSEPCVGDNKNEGPKTDPFAHLYSHVCKPASSVTSSTSSPSSSLTLKKTLATRRPTAGVPSGHP
ncbi:hypothetical protein UPYG_G00044330 [Umbra pygmaea]|uniref:IRS-type PTB domain-containing protein n=1 Tax=Umbra pygmaea TaxID=75934 RepID=A0ABD0XSB4_UMBPY